MNKNTKTKPKALNTTTKNKIDRKETISKAKKGLTIITIITVVLLVSVITGISYAFFRGPSSETSKTQTSIRSKKLGLIFADKKEVDVEMYPGKKETKTFDVKSNSDTSMTYNIKIVNITNTYNEDVVYTLYRDNTKVAGPARLPKNALEHYIFTGLTIEPGVTHSYTLEMEYLNTEEIQVLNGESFNGTIEIDIKEVDTTTVYTPENTTTITNQTAKKAFEVKNVSSKVSTKYNVKLEGLVNHYANLRYRLEKNGVLVKEDTMPTDGELPYLVVNQQLQAGASDRYKLTLLNAGAEEFSARIVIDNYDVDTTGPTSTLTYKEKTSNSVTFTGTCSDEDSQITNYYFYKDNTLVSTQATDASEVEYKYEGVSEGEHTFKLTCENYFGMKSSASQTASPNALVMPQIATEEGYKTSKTVTLTYSGEGDYLFKMAEGSATSNENVKTCEVDETTWEYSCSDATSTTDISTQTWYKTEGNITLTYTANGKIQGLTIDGVNHKLTEETNVNGIDTTGPSANLTVSSHTSNTTTVSVTSADNESGITKYEFYLDNTLTETKNISDTEVSYTYEGITSGSHTYKVVTTNGSGMTTDASQTYTTEELSMPTYSFDSGWAQSKEVYVDYHDSEGMHLYKVTGEVTSDKDAVSCVEESESVYTCTRAFVAAGNRLSENTWYKTEGNTTLTFNSNGSVIAKTADGINTKSGSSQTTTKIDRTSPTIAISSGNYTSGEWTTTDVTVTITSTDTISGVDHYEMKIGDGDWETIASNIKTFDSDINTTVKFRTLDKALNTSEEKEIEIKIDKTDPTVTFGTNGNSTYAKSQSTTVTITDANLDTNSLKYKWTQSATAPEENEFSDTFTNGDTITKDGVTGNNWYLWIIAKDEVGNIVIEKTNAFYLDNQAPICAITGNPTSFQMTSATLVPNVSDSNEGTVYYSWDNENNYSTTKTNKTASANGTYTLYVKDGLNNATNCSVTVSKIDTTAPDVDIETKSKTSNSVTVTGSCSDTESDITSYAFYADGVLDQTYNINDATKDHTYSGLTSGNHTLKLVCTNGATNTAEKSIIAAPSNLITPEYSVTSGYAQSKTTTIDFQSSEGTYLFKSTALTTSNVDVYECSEVSSVEYTCSETAASSITSGTWYKVTSNPTLTFTSNGTIVAKVADEVNEKPGSSLTITGIDRTAPSIPTITNPSNGEWTNQNINLTLSATDTAGSNESASGVAGFQLKYSTTNNEWGTSINVVATNGSATDTWGAERNETVYYRAVDEVGNVGPEVSTDIKIDKTAPQIIAPTGDSAYAKTKSVTVTIKDTRSGLKTGNEVQYTWSTSNTTAPTTWTNATLSSYSNGTTSDVTFTATGSDLTGDYYLWIHPVTLKDIAENATTTNVVSTDTYKFDNQAPTGCSISGNPTNWVTSATLTPATVTDAHNGTVYYSWDNENNYSATKSNKTVNANGTYTLYVKDGLGNSTSCNVSVSKIDTTAPSITLGSNSDSTYAKTKSVTVTIKDTQSGLKSGNSVQYAWSTSNTTAPTSWTNATLSSYSAGTTGNVTFTATGSGLTGSYYLWVHPVTLKDTIENATTANVVSTGTFKFDNTAPKNCSLTVSNTGTVTNRNLTIGTATDEHHGSVNYQLKKGTSELVAYSTSKPGNGTYNVTENATYTLYCKDDLGNETSSSATVTGIDRDNPSTCTISLDNPGNGSMRVNFSGSDPTSSISKYVVYYGTASNSMTSTKEVASTSSNTTISNLTNGTTYYFKVRCYDDTGVNYKDSSVVSKSTNIYRYYSSSTSQTINSTSTSRTLTTYSSKTTSSTYYTNYRLAYDKAVQYYYTGADWGVQNRTITEASNSKVTVTSIYLYTSANISRTLYSTIWYGKGYTSLETTTSTSVFGPTYLANNTAPTTSRYNYILPGGNPYSSEYTEDTSFYTFDTYKSIYTRSYLYSNYFRSYNYGWRFNHDSWSYVLEFTSSNNNYSYSKYAITRHAELGSGYNAASALYTINGDTVNGLAIKKDVWSNFNSTYMTYYSSYKTYYRTDTTTFYTTKNDKNTSVAGRAYFSTRYALE